MSNLLKERSWVGFPHSTNIFCINYNFVFIYVSYNFTNHFKQTETIFSIKYEDVVIKFKISDLKTVSRLSKFLVNERSIVCVNRINSNIQSIKLLCTSLRIIRALSLRGILRDNLLLNFRIRHDLMTFGDRFTEKEADYALDEAPIIQKNGNTMIDYIRFCSQLCGLRKPNKKPEEI